MRLLFIIFIITLLCLSGCSESDWKDIVCGADDKSLWMKLYCIGHSSGSSSDSDSTTTTTLEDEEKKGECLYDSECPPICQGAIAVKRGCNPRVGKCESLEEKDCAQDKVGIEVYSVPNTCQDGLCAYDYAGMKVKRAEISQEMADIRAKRAVMVGIRNKAKQICAMGSDGESTSQGILAQPRIQMPNQEMQDELGSEITTKMDRSIYTSDSALLIKDYCDVADFVQFRIEDTDKKLKDMEAVRDQMYEYLQYQNQ
jgi:hypothetical protein